MSVHINVEKIQVPMMAFEVRYDDGFRYLDHCGEAISRIRRYDKSWVHNTVTPQGGGMMNSSAGLAFNFSIDRLNVAVQGETSLADGEKRAEVLGQQGEALYELIVECIRAPETSRIGIRYRYTAPSDTLEEADRFVCRGAKSSLLDAVLRSTRSDLRDSSVYYVVEDLESGYKRRIAIESQVTVKAGDPAYTGLEKNGVAAVSIDIDTFTRPETGHFPKSNLFIQNNYTRSRAIALELFSWFRQQR